MWTDDSILHLVWFSVFIFRGIEFFLLKCPHPPLLDHHALPRTSLACSIKSQIRKKLYLQKLVLFRNNRLLYVFSYFQKYSKVFKHFARGHYIKYKPRSNFRRVRMSFFFATDSIFSLLIDEKIVKLTLVAPSSGSYLFLILTIFFRKVYN